MNLDLTTLPNRGVYNPPHWIHEVETHTSSTGDLVLAYPEGRTAEKLLKKMQDVPAWDASKYWEEAQGESLNDPTENIELEQLEESAVQPEEPQGPPKLAIAKVDPNQRFDFFANMPTPRAKPREVTSKVESLAEQKDTVEAEQRVEQQVEPVPRPSFASLEAATKESEAAVDAIRRLVFEGPVKSVKPSVSAKNLKRIRTFEKAANAIEASVTSLHKDVREGITALASDYTIIITPESKWRHASLGDIAIKFAVSLLGLSLF